MKRLYVQPHVRGEKLGLRLVERSLCKKHRHAGYARICLDSSLIWTGQSNSITDSGFKSISPYIYNPIPGAIFLRIDL